MGHTHVSLSHAEIQGGFGTLKTACVRTRNMMASLSQTSKPPEHYITQK